MSIQRSFIPEVFPVNPIEPAIREFNPRNVSYESFRGNFDGENIGRPWMDKTSHIKLMIDIHSGNLCIVGNQLSIQPDLCTIINPRKINPDSASFRRNWKAGAIPPVLLVKILRHLCE